MAVLPSCRGPMRTIGKWRSARRTELTEAVPYIIPGLTVMASRRDCSLQSGGESSIRHADLTCPCIGRIEFLRCRFFRPRGLSEQALAAGLRRMGTQAYFSGWSIIEIDHPFISGPGFE